MACYNCFQEKRIFSFFLICFLLPGLALAAPLFSEAIASYTMENTTGAILRDSSANHYDSVNGLGGTSVVSSIYGNALQFDGSDIVSLGTKPDFMKTTAFTIEASFRIDGYTTGDWVRVVGNGNASTRNYGLWYHSDGSILFQITNSSGTWHHPITYITIETNRWYHMAGVFTGTQMFLYLDGSQVDQVNFVGTPYTNSNDALTIGAAPGYHTAHIGLIDNVALFNTALTQQDIQRHSQGLDITSIPEPASILTFFIVMVMFYMHCVKKQRQ